MADSSHATASASRVASRDLSTSSTSRLPSAKAGPAGGPGGVPRAGRVAGAPLPDRIALEALADRLEARAHLGGHPRQHVDLREHERRSASERVAERFGAAWKRRPALGV